MPEEAKTADTTIMPVTMGVQEVADLDLWKRRITSGSGLKQRQIKQFRRWEQWAEGRLPDTFKRFYLGRFAWRSSMVPLDAVENLRRYLGKVINSIFSIEDWLELSGLEGYEDLAEQHRRLIHFQFFRPEFNFRKFLTDAFDTWEVYGLAIALDNWIDNQETGYEGYSKILVDPFRFTPAPYFDNQNRLPWFVIDTVVFWKDLEAMAAKKGWKQDKVAEVEKLLDSFPWDQVDESVLLIKKGETLDRAELKRLKPVLLQECYSDQKITTIGQNNVELGTVENLNPGNGVHFLNMGARRKIYSNGVMGVMEDVFHTMFMEWNASLDTGRQQSNPAVITNDPKPPTFLQAGPGIINKVNSPVADYKVLELELKPEIHFNHAMAIRQMIKDHLNLTDVFAGRSPGSTRTATEHQLVAKGAAGDLDFLIKEVEDVFVIPIVYQALTVNGIKLPEALKQDYVQVIGLKSKDQILNNWTIRVVGSSTASSRAIINAQLGQKAGQWASNPYQASFFDWYWLTKTEVDAFMPDLPNKDRILPPPEAKIEAIMRENQLLMQGVEIPVIKGDEHQLHIQGHEQLLQSFKMQYDQGVIPPHLQQMFADRELQPEIVQANIINHIAQHKQFLAELTPKIHESRVDMPTKESDLAKGQGKQQFRALPSLSEQTV